MKALILAGGLGTRLSEETVVKPKPLVEIGSMPIIWHLMKQLSCFDINEFIILVGHKGYQLKEYFVNYALHANDISIDFQTNEIQYRQISNEKWKVTLVDTGEKTLTGGRLRRALNYVKDDSHFLFTYGDGLSDVNIRDLEEFHISHGKLATVTAVQPSGRFGALELEGKQVSRFQEKPKGDGSWINGGFFILSPDVIDLIDSDQTSFENEPLETLARMQQLFAFKHDGFWHPMDTLRDKNYLTQLWTEERAPWKQW